MAEFIFVHGGMHGGWCWDLVRQELDGRGHKSVAMDVPLHEISCNIDDYVASVVDASASLGEDAIIVGHSLGGLIIPHVAQHRPVGRMIFLCSMIAPRTQDELQANLDLVNPEFWDMVQRDDLGRAVCTPEVATKAFFHDVPEPLRDWAISRMTPLAPNVYTPPPLIRDFPKVPVSSIVADEDFVVRDPRMEREHVRTRLGVEPVTLPGSHSPFLSHPALLASALEAEV